MRPHSSTARRQISPCEVPLAAEIVWSIVGAFQWTARQTFTLPRCFRRLPSPRWRFMLIYLWIGMRLESSRKERILQRHAASQAPQRAPSPAQLDIGSFNRDQRGARRHSYALPARGCWPG